MWLCSSRIRSGAKVNVEFDLKPLPTLTCRPQLLSAVFSSLLSNAINAVDGGGHIVISSRLADAMVEVRIRDNGRGMKPEEVENIFDPGFRVSDARVSAGNWSLFNIRQVVYEHGATSRSKAPRARALWSRLPFRAECASARLIPGPRPLAPISSRTFANRQGRRPRIYMRIAQVEDLVDGETSADDVEISKPAPDNDPEAAGELGPATIGLLCGGFPEEALRCFAIFRDPEDLLANYEAVKEAFREQALQHAR